MSAEAAVYLTPGKISVGIRASISTDHPSANHANQRPRQTHLTELVLIACQMAMNEMTRNRKSMARHHPGASLQQDFAQVCATNKKGVARQWIMHKKLAAAPKESAL